MHIIPYLVTFISIIGTVANSYKKSWCFYLWLFTNGFWCVYNVIYQSYAQSILYAVYFVLSIVGIVQWKKGANNEKRL